METNENTFDVLMDDDDLSLDAPTGAPNDAPSLPPGTLAGEWISKDTICVDVRVRCRICATTWEDNIELVDVEEIEKTDDGQPIHGGSFPDNMTCPTCGCDAGDCEGADGQGDMEYA